MIQLYCLAPFGGVGTSILTEDDSVSDGHHSTIGTVVFSFFDEPLHHPVRDHVPPVGDAFIVGKSGEDDFGVVLLGVKQMFSASE